MKDVQSVGLVLEPNLLSIPDIELSIYYLGHA